MPDTRTASELFAEANADAAAQAAAKAADDQRQRQEAVAGTLKQIADNMKASTERWQKVDERLSAIEGSTSRQVTPPDPYKSLTEQIGVTAEDFRPAVRHEVASEVNRILEEKLGPSVREAAAVQQYQETHDDFDANKFHSYLSKNPEVRAVVNEVRSKGAYIAGIEYGELRRQLDEKIEGEAKGQGKANRRKQMVEEFRPDAQVMGTTASPQARHVSQPLSAEKVDEIYGHANAGNWKPFEKAFHESNLPAEDWWQKLAQS